MTLAALVRYLWASPASVVGLAGAAAAFACGARARRVDGVLEIGGGRLRKLLQRAPVVGGFEAVTLGHVVIGLDEAALERSRAHERAHVAQYERWGVLFFAAYFVSSLAAFMRGRDPYHDNHFEREACSRAAAPHPPAARMPRIT